MELICNWNATNLLMMEGFIILRERIDIILALSIFCIGIISLFRWLFGLLWNKSIKSFENKGMEKFTQAEKINNMRKSGRVKLLEPNDLCHHAVKYRNMNRMPKHAIDASKRILSVLTIFIRCT